MGQSKAQEFAQRGAIPLYLDRYGDPLVRNFTHVEDVVSAIICTLGKEKAFGELFNISMSPPINYAEFSTYV